MDRRCCPRRGLDGVTRAAHRKRFLDYSPSGVLQDPDCAGTVGPIHNQMILHPRMVVVEGINLVGWTFQVESPDTFTRVTFSEHRLEVRTSIRVLQNPEGSCARSVERQVIFFPGMVPV